MHPRRTVPGTVAAAALALLLLVSTARADGATAEQLIAIAQQLGMSCAQVDATLERCGGETGAAAWAVEIRPASGAVTGLVTVAHTTIAPLDPGSVRMMDDLHDPTCADPSAVEAFVAKVAAFSASAKLGPTTIGTCTMTGELAAAPRDYTYTVSSSVVAPTPAPTPTPSATPTLPATASPVASPSVVATLRATPTVGSSATASATPAASASPSGSPTESASTTPSESATASPRPTPEGAVAGVTGSPAPSVQPRSRPVRGQGFARSVADPSQVRFDGASLGGSALLALILLLVMAFPGELFNSTVDANYDEMAGWFRRLRLRGLGGLWRGAVGAVLLLAAGALIYSLLDPGFGLDAGSAAAYLGLLIGLVVTLAAFELPGLLLHRRTTGELGAFRALPWTLLAGAACVLISRLASFEPGYLYGVLLGVTFRLPDSARDEGREAAAGALWTLLVALAAWLGLGWLRSTAGTGADAGLIRIAAETALATVVVAGLEAVAFGMVPMRFLGGAAVRAWSRIAWALLFFAGVFAFVHVLVGPQSGYLAELAPSGLLAALAVFAAFALVSFGLWGYFRFRPARAEE